MIRVTFSLDEDTVARLRRTAARLRKPQSQVVREAVADYAARGDRLSETERLRMLRVLRALAAAKPTRSHTTTHAELRTIRAGRRQGGRRHRIGR